MDARTAARSLAAPIGSLGARFMLDGASFGRGAELGLPPGVGTYVLGRLGVLGDVDADTACEAAHFFTPEVIRANWAPTDDLPASQAAAIYGQICVEMGRTYLDGFEGAGRLAELAASVADDADPTDAALFAGWRDQARPDDDTGRAYLLVTALRELRFCRHVVAVKAAGADPHGMLIANKGLVTLFGWPEDGTATDPEIRDAIEDATDEASAVDYATLGDDERAELVALASAAFEHCT